MRRSNTHGWDESHVKVRPNKKGSRPRTKDRPQHEDAVIGRIVAVDRGRYRAVLEEDTRRERLVTAARAKELHRKNIVPGDFVSLVGDTSGEKGSLARIVKIQPRSTFLRRSADDTDVVERMIVANVDQLIIVVASANPEPRTGFIDRALVAAYDAGIEPVLCVTKTDLRDPEHLLRHYEDLDLRVVTTSTLASDGAAAPFDAEGEAPRGSAEVRSEALEAVRAVCESKVSVLVGHSGVGKSTLVNGLTGADRATGGVNAVTGRGRHTSSSALMLQVPETEETTWIIDTPGVRSFGLGHVDPENLVLAFEELAPAVADCPKGCAHGAESPGCALDAWVAEGRAGASGERRLEQMRRLLRVDASAEPEAKQLGSL